MTNILAIGFDGEKSPYPVVVIVNRAYEIERLELSNFSLELTARLIHDVHVFYHPNARCQSRADAEETGGQEIGGE